MFSALIAGLTTGLWMFYFVFTILSMLVILALILNAWTFFTFSYRQSLSSPTATRGDKIDFRLHINNNKPFPYTITRLVINTPSSDCHEQSMITLNPYSYTCFDVHIDCKHRGVYEVGMSDLVITDFFGLLHMRFDLNKLSLYRPVQLVIYPRLLPLFSSLPKSVHHGTKYEDVGTQRPVDEGENFYDTRQYRMGDPFKRIHRVVSARRKQLHVKRYDTSMEPSVLIAIDTGANDSSIDEQLRCSDIACECTVALAYHFLHIGYTVALLSSHEAPILECTNIQDFSKIYDCLATIKFGESSDICASLSYALERRNQLSIVFVISSRQDCRFMESLAMFSQAAKNTRLIIPVSSDDSDKNSLFTDSGIAVFAVSDVSELGAVL